MIRQPIITICGHVDHGKTTLLDSIRGSCVAEKEAGLITQKISFTLFPSEYIEKRCESMKGKLKIPGFLFIDTPGHAAFTNLRKRGGSLADIAVLVVDINEGIMPQTKEVIQILKAGKTPFVIALNKIDRISGWKKQSENMKENIEKQAIHTKELFDEKLYTFMSALNFQGFNGELFYNIDDFTKKIALIPCSAKTKEGLKDLLAALCGLSQKFLEKRLEVGRTARGIVLEVKKEKTISYLECILYDGKLSVKDEIAIAGFDKTTITKIRLLQEAMPLCRGYENAGEIRAASGFRMQVIEKDEILPGMPFMIFKGNKEQIEKEFKKELTESIKLDKEGIIVKADSLGSLEALLTLLRQASIKVSKAGIGSISKQDILTGKAILEKNEAEGVILGFNVEIDKEIDEKDSKNIKILTNEVVYKLIEDLVKWQGEKRKEIEKRKLERLASPCRLHILHNFVFRDSKPAIFGVKVEVGKLKPGSNLINSNGEEIARTKSVQKDGKNVDWAVKGEEVAISLPGITFSRQLKDENVLYADISEEQFRNFKKNKNILGSGDISLLQELAQIKRKEKPTWGI